MNWEEAATRIQAIPLVLYRNGMRALVKFDGQRDDGRIYTVVLDRCDPAGPVLRTDTSDLARALATVFPVASDAGAEQISSLADALRRCDDLARHGSVVGLHAERASGSLVYSVFVLHGGEVLADSKGTDLHDVVLKGLAQFEAREH